MSQNCKLTWQYRLIGSTKIPVAVLLTDVQYEGGAATRTICETGVVNDSFLL